MIVKLFAFGVSPLPLKLVYSYLSNRTQQIKINKKFSDRTDIEFGVPQACVFGSLLFNIDMNNLFYKCEDSNVASYTDDTTTYSCVTELFSVCSLRITALCN